MLCMSILAARKADLLDEVDSKFNNQSILFSLSLSLLFFSLFCFVLPPFLLSSDARKADLLDEVDSKFNNQSISLLFSPLLFLFLFFLLSSFLLMPTKLRL